MYMPLTYSFESHVSCFVVMERFLLKRKIKVVEALSIKAILSKDKKKKSYFKGMQQETTGV